jgi:hypothetical protein
MNIVIQFSIPLPIIALLRITIVTDISVKATVMRPLV